MFRSHWSSPVLAALCLLALAPWSPTEAKAGKSLVVGSIMPCSGLPAGLFKHLKLPHRAAGTVFVLKGELRRTRQGGWSLPKHVIAKQTVPVNGTFRFAVFPGRYVLAARLAHSNAGGFIRIIVREGKTVRVVIPNSCK